MKKIISLGLASAVCALTAVVASADAVSYVTEGKAATGETITVTVVAGQSFVIPAFFIELDGFELVGKPTAAGMASYNEATKKYTLMSDGVVAGNTIATITLKVTADAGKTAKMTLKNAADQAVDYNAFSLTVEGAAASTPSESTPSESKPAESTPSESKPADDTTNPGTGVALAVVPAVLAAAGVVVAKKRK